MAIKILDPDMNLHDSSHRGGGRFLQVLHENLSEHVSFIPSLKEVTSEDTLLIPFWRPHQPGLLKKRIAKRQIITIFDVIPLKYPSKFPFGFKGKLGLLDNLNNLHHYDTIITISEASKQDIVQYLNIPPEKIEVVHLTTRSLFFHSQKDEHRPEHVPHLPFCVYVGDINWNKNIVNIARALKIAKVKGVFVGKAFTDAANDIDHAEREEYRLFKKECRDNDLFVFPGYVPDNELTQYYRYALCNILMSRDEGFGLSYLEAASQKCPSVLSNIPVFNEVAQDTALFADPEDPQSIAEKIVRLQNDEGTRKKYIQASQLRLKHLSPIMFASRMKALLEI